MKSRINIHRRRKRIDFRLSAWYLFRTKGISDTSTANTWPGTPYVKAFSKSSLTNDPSLVPAEYIKYAHKKEINNANQITDFEMREVLISLQDSKSICLVNHAIIKAHSRLAINPTKKNNEMNVYIPSSISTKPNCFPISVCVNTIKKTPI